MLLLSFSAIVLMLSLESSQAFYNNYNREGARRMPMCPLWNKPCRLRARMSNIHGSELESNSAETCSCSPQHGACSSDWSRPRHVVARKVVSTTYNITLEMMFCSPVEPKRLCRSDDTALMLTGPMAMPLDIVAYNCRCRRRQPLLLHKREVREDHMIYHTYVCANHKPYCLRNSACMTIEQSFTDYHCKCRSGFQCTPNEYGYGNGFCTRV